MSTELGYRGLMTEPPDPTERTAEAPAPTEDEDVDVADVSGGAVPEQLLEDGEGGGPERH